MKKLAAAIITLGMLFMLGACAAPQLPMEQAVIGRWIHITGAMEPFEFREDGTAEAFGAEGTWHIDDGQIIMPRAEDAKAVFDIRVTGDRLALGYMTRQTGRGNSLIGRWGIEFDGEFDEDFWLKFFDDGTGSVLQDGEEFEFAWHVEGNQLSMTDTPMGDLDQKFAIVDDALWFYVFERVEGEPPTTTQHSVRAGLFRANGDFERIPIP